MDSEFVCWVDGIPLVNSRGSWRHQLNGRNGEDSVPKDDRHEPVPCPREDYEQAHHPDTPLHVARAIAAKYS